MGTYVHRECISEGHNPGNVSTGGEILTPSESEGIVLLSLLNFSPDVWVSKGCVILIKTKLLTS